MSARTIGLLGLTALALGLVAWNAVPGSGLEFWCLFLVALIGVAIVIGAFRMPRGPEPLAPVSEYQGIDQ